MNGTMDNQQATSHQIAWLSGIWDGEGTFSITQTPKSYVGRLTLSNTCPIMINEITKILDSHGIVGHIWQEESSRKPNHKKAYHFTLTKLSSVKKAIELMLPYLVSKRARAEILLRFVNSRLEYKIETERDEKGRITSVKKQGFDKETTFFDQLKELNKTGI